MKRILIVGCGRSGTQYTATLLRMAGLDVGHETDKPGGVVDWHRACPEPGVLDKYDVILHQVREPLSSVASFHTIGNESWNYICSRELRIFRDDPILLRSMKYWAYWNLRAQSVAQWTFRVESLPGLLPKILAAVDWKIPGQKAAAKIAALPTNVHTRKELPSYGKELTWEKMSQENEAVFGLVESVAHSYGYVLPDWRAELEAKRAAEEAERVAQENNEASRDALQQEESHERKDVDGRSYVEGPSGGVPETRQNAAGGLPAGEGSRGVGIAVQDEAGGASQAGTGRNG